MLSSNQKGAIAEKAVELAAIKAGIGVYRPVAEGGGCDLIFEIGDRLLRVQCKWVAQSGDTIQVRCYSCFRNRDRFVRQSYGAHEIDALAAYCPELERCYVLPSQLFSTRTEVRLRLTPARNNQKRRTHPAHRFEFEKVNWSEFTRGP